MRQGDQGPHRGGGESLEKREARFASGDLQRPSSPPRQRGNVGVFERKRQPEPNCKTLDEGGVQIGVGSPDVMVKMGHAGEVDMTALGELVQDEEQRRGVRSPRDRGDDNLRHHIHLRFETHFLPPSVVTVKATNGYRTLTGRMHSFPLLD